jgi:hypothetical protein
VVALARNLWGMREYVVQAGDSPASIAARPEMAGCPRCSRDLIAANSHKPFITHKNGFRTFREMRAGEHLNLPDKWFDGTLDRMPPSYFKALPHHDGVTPSSGVSGLGDLAQYDVAAAAVATLAALGDQPFSNTVNGVAAAIDAAVGEIHGTGAPAVYAMPYAQEVLKATATARQRATVLATAIAAGDQAAGAQARNDILHDFSGALTSAQLALQAFYGDPAQVLVDVGPAKIDPVTLVAAAKAAAAAIGSDPNFCTAVAQPGSTVNAAVHAFKTAWNAANPRSPVPVNTGKYEQATADVLKQLLGTAPAACGGAQVIPPPSIPLVVPVVPPQPRSGLGVGGVLGLTALGAGAVGGAIYLATRAPSKGRRRRVRRVPSEEEAL